MKLRWMALALVALFCSVAAQAESQQTPDRAYYRGGRYMDPRPNDYKINKETGKVRIERGVSLSTNKYKMQNFGGAYRVASYPSSLAIRQQGPPEHFEICPAVEMALDDYKAALARVVLEREDW